MDLKRTKVETKLETLQRENEEFRGIVTLLETENRRLQTENKALQLVREENTRLLADIQTIQQDKNGLIETGRILF